MFCEVEEGGKRGAVWQRGGGVAQVVEEIVSAGLGESKKKNLF